MKLQPSAWYLQSSLCNFICRGIHKQQHRRDKSRQQACQFSGLLGRDVAGAGGVKHKADGVGTGGH